MNYLLSETTTKYKKATAKCCYSAAPFWTLTAAVPDGGRSSLEVLMVAIHDHEMRFVGHHRLVLHRTQEKLVEAQVEELTKLLEQHAGRYPRTPDIPFGARKIPPAWYRFGKFAPIYFG